MEKYDIVQLVTRSDTLGGVHNHIIEIIKFTNFHKLKTIVLVGDSSQKKFIKKLIDEDIDYKIVSNLIVKINLLFDIKALFELIKILRIINPKLICLHSSKAGILGRVAAFILKIPSIFTVHGWSFSIKTNFAIRIFYFLLEYILQFCTYHIITDSFADKKLAEKIGFRIKKISAIPNCSSFDDQPQKNILNNKSKEILLLTISRIDYQKDFKSLFLALSHLPNNLKWKLIYVGDGILKSEAQYLARKLKINSKIEFVGFKTQLKNYYMNADVFVLSSNWEGLPITLLDAMNFGLPMIATNVGGCSDVISHGYNGFLVPHKSPKHISFFLEKLIKDKNLRLDLGCKSKKIYQKIFNKDIFNNKTFNLYKDYIKQ